MKWLHRVERWLATILQNRYSERLTHRFGGTQTCPWCRQCVQTHPHDWSLTTWDRDPFLDVLSCSVCRGTSLWKFEMGLSYIGPLAAPVPSMTPSRNYDIVNARLTMTWTPVP